MRVDDCQARDPALDLRRRRAYLSLRLPCRALIRRRHRSRRAPVAPGEADVTEPSHELERPVSAGP
jgi:hypothetical protein